MDEPKNKWELPLIIDYIIVHGGLSPLLSFNDIPMAITWVDRQPFKFLVHMLYPIVCQDYVCIKWEDVKINALFKYKVHAKYSNIIL